MLENYKDKINSVFYIKVDEKYAGIKIEKFLINDFDFLSVTIIYKLIRTKEIKINNKKIEINYKLQCGDVIRMPPIENYKTNHKPRVKKAIVVSKEQIREISSRIIYKDNDVMVINKPADLAVQGGTGLTFNLDAVLDYLKFESDERPCLVHRLDKDTTGTILIARNTKMAAYLLEEFKNQRIKKIYKALSLNFPTIDSGIINEPLLKVGAINNQKVVIDKINGKEATTKYNVIKKSDFACLIQAEPLTGRTHQIRVHLSSKLKCPIVGDFKYNFVDSFKLQFNQKKLYLHSNIVEFTSINGKKIKVDAPFDDDFLEALKYLNLL